MLAPIVYFKTEWMEFFDGRRGDKPPGEFLYVAEHGHAHEDRNFRDVDGNRYAYAPIAGGGGGVNIQRLGASPNADYIDGVDLVFIAKGPDRRGVVVVGWYRNARIYKVMQHRRQRAFLAECKSAYATLIPTDERWLRIQDPPRRTNVWYGRSDTDTAVRRLMGGARGRRTAALSATRDVERCLKIEFAAYDVVIQHFRERGYDVTSVHRDKVGWDLEASRDDVVLQLEVKGTEQSELRAELTPNEFARSSEYSGYRVCIVTNALAKLPTLHVFKANFKKRWFDESGGLELLFEKRIAARLTAQKVT